MFKIQFIIILYLKFIIFVININNLLYCIILCLKDNILFFLLLQNSLVKISNIFLSYLYLLFV